MSRIVDLELINSRSREIEQVIQDARYVETFEGEGRDFESIKDAARKALNLPEDVRN